MAKSGDLLIFFVHFEDDKGLYARDMRVRGRTYYTMVSLEEGLHDVTVGVADEHNVTAPREGETGASEGVECGDGTVGSGNLELRNPIIDGEVLEVHVDDGLHQLSPANLVIPAPINASEIHEDDTCGTGIVLLKDIEDGGMGVGGVVAVAVRE